VILEAPFDSLVEVGRHHFPFLPVRWLLRDRFESAAKIDRVQAPLLIFHGAEDEVVPQPRGRALFEAAKEPKVWVDVPGVGHNDLRFALKDRFYDRIDAFLEPIRRGR